MRKHLAIVALGVLIVLALLINIVAFSVDQFRDIVLVKRFGRVVAVYRGPEAAGLHFKLPWPAEQTVTYDARLFMIESPYQEVTTRDKQTILVQTFCDWQIGDAAKFHQTVGTADKANDRLRRIIQDNTQTVIGAHDLANFISTDPAEMQLPQIEQQIFELAQTSVQHSYGDGIRLQRVGIKTWGLPQETSAQVIESQRRERLAVAEGYTSSGAAAAKAIRDRATASSDTVLAFADRRAAAIRSEGEAAAADVYKQFNAAPELSAFLRSLDSLRTELKRRAVIVLDGSTLPAINWFSQGPSVPGAQTPTQAKKPAQPE